MTTHRASAKWVAGEQKTASGKEIGKEVRVLRAGQPVLHPGSIVQLRVAPLQIDLRCFAAPFRRTLQRRRGRFCTYHVMLIPHPGTVQLSPVR